MIELKRLERTIKGIHFPYPVMVAAGVVKTFEQARALADTDVIPELGSFTTEECAGNGGRDYHAEYAELPGYGRVLLYTQNSLGLPNPGMKHIEQHGRELIRRFADQGKPIAVSVSGESIEDTVTLVKRAIEVGFPIVTVNGSCPNRIQSEFRPIEIMCFDTEAVATLITRLDAEVGVTNTVVLLKVSAGMPRHTLLNITIRVGSSRIFDGLVTCNTVPNTLNYRADNMPTILTEKGFRTRGGMGGPAILPIALDHTEFAAHALPAGKFVIGVGGIGNAYSANKFFSRGAVLTQINSAYREAHEDPGFMTSLLLELAEL